MAISEEEDSDVVVRPKRAGRPNIKSETITTMGKPQISPAPNDFARSHTANWTPPVPVAPEADALRSVKVRIPSFRYAYNTNL
jgi:hypothetical protein